jgi:DNA mismatch endonuclease (patch repair protein)
MRDPLTKTERSTLMAKVKGRGNKSTEMVVCAALRRHRVSGWRRHPKNVFGRPDFYFPSQKLAVFVDGCFWHSCPKCGRTPKTRVHFWASKIQNNHLRDIRVDRRLRNNGVMVLRIWEHEIATSSERWITRILNKLRSHEIRRASHAHTRLADNHGFDLSMSKYKMQEMSLKAATT